jgi:hypothetical protein
MQLSRALYVPHYIVQALRARGKRAVVLPHAFGLPAIDARYARRPRRTLCSHDFQRASRKLSVHEVVSCASCAPHHVQALRARGKQSSYFTLLGCQLFSQGGPGVRLAWHRRRQQALRRQRCTARRIGGCDKHCDTKTMHSPTAFHTDAQHGRDVRYAHTIINAHHVS